MSMDFPFEPTEAAPMLDEHVHYSGGVVVMAANVGDQAAVVFRFSTPEGLFYPPVVLVLDPEQMAKFPGLVDQAAKCALDAAGGGS